MDFGLWTFRPTFYMFKWINVKYLTTEWLPPLLIFWRSWVLYILVCWLLWLRLLRFFSVRQDNIRRSAWNKFHNHFFILYLWFRSSWLWIDKIQQDATVCRYLFTASLLYMFRASIVPIIRSTKNCNRSLWYRSLHHYYDLYQRLRLQFLVLLMMGTMDARNM